ncbi:superoxide dismutase [bacterium]|nr:superoxide dismutase [bacterium]MBT3730210.1 superoxide dismutase [bacterium]MBT4894753.1 superoxide dismutase [bacterium]
MIYKEQQFDIPALDGISEKQIQVHLGLYAGYVKHVNLIREKVEELKGDDYVVAELRRRFSFEFDGMRMHEYYFSAFEGGAKEVDQDSELVKALSEKYGSWDDFIEHFKAVGKSRGIGWTVLYWDPKARTPHVAWTSDHELGTLSGLPILLAMDMWEHAFMVDYLPAEKGKYIDSFLNNVNWSFPEKMFNYSNSK